MGLFPEWTWIIGLLIGAAIGSFLNVVIYRMPRQMSLANPPNSFCPACNHRLGIPDLFPLFSWLFLRGKCRHCGQKVSSRYFFVELLNGAIWAGLWHQYLVASWDPWKALFYALGAAALVAIIFIDWELYIIPDEINVFLLVLGLVYQGFFGSIVVGIQGALLGWAILWGIAVLGRVLFKKDAMGHGDIKMMRGIGALLGPVLLTINVGLAVLLGAFLGILFIFIEKGRQKRSGVIEAEAEEEEAPPAAESFRSLFILGGVYLVGGDAVALFVPKMYDGLKKLLPNDDFEDDEDWEPSLTTIPFGPYLAAGAILCMLFQKPILAGVQSYIDSMSQPQAGLLNPPAASGRQAVGSLRIYGRFDRMLCCPDCSLNTQAAGTPEGEVANSRQPLQRRNYLEQFERDCSLIDGESRSV